MLKPIADHPGKFLDTETGKTVVIAVRLDDWHVARTSDDPFKAPEQTGIVLVGVVRGHPTKPDGERIITSRAVRSEGRAVHTENGSAYYLGEPSEKYRAWLRDNRPNWDAENPIKLNHQG